MQTITKTRVVAQHQQVVRIDREKRRPISEKQVNSPFSIDSLRFSERSTELLSRTTGKVSSLRKLVAGLLETAAGHNVTITVDPEPGNPIEWRGVTTVKPNRSEAFASAGLEDTHRDEGVDPLTDDPLLQTGQMLLEKWACHQILLTLGEQGMLVFTEGIDPVHIPARAREVFDVSGAGDTAIAIYTLGLCAGLEAPVAAAISNLASSIVVGKLGTTPIEKEELAEAIFREYPEGLPTS